MTLACFGRCFLSIEVGRKYGPEPYNLKCKYTLWNYRYSRPERKNIGIFRGIFGVARNFALNPKSVKLGAGVGPGPRLRKRVKFGPSGFRKEQIRSRTNFRKLAALRAQVRRPGPGHLYGVSRWERATAIGAGRKPKCKLAAKGSKFYSRERMIWFS